AVVTLQKVLEDPKQEPMVRHEAAEALGALESKSSLDILEKYRHDSTVEVAETCQLALDRIAWLSSTEAGEELSKNPFSSVDPAPPLNCKDLAELRKILISSEESLFRRYRAMFALRNLQSKEAVDVLGDALKVGSALFKHEVAFVLGQMQSDSSVKYLIDSLEDLKENE
nr:nero [Cucujiformia]